MFQFKQNILVDNYKVRLLLLLLFSFFFFNISDQHIISLKLATYIKQYLKVNGPLLI